MSPSSSARLPTSWVTADFGVVFENVTSSKKKLARQSYSLEGAFPVIDQGEEFIGGYSDKQELVHPGPLPVIIFGDHTRCVKFCDRRFIQGADGVKVLAPSAAVEPKFGYWALRAAHIPSKGYARHFDLLRSTRFPLAPLPEQTRIVEAIESYFTRLDNAVATLERVQANLKRYRASVLKAAVEGRLVPTEAELARQEGRDYEPASELLKRILAERRRRWEEAELASLKAKGKAPKDDKWKAKYEEPAAPDTSQLPELPEGWCWIEFGTVMTVRQGFAFKSADYLDDSLGVPLIRQSELNGPWVSVDTAKHLPSEYLREFVRYKIQEGDILVGLSGSLTSVSRYQHNQPALQNQRTGLLETSPLVSKDFVLCTYLSRIRAIESAGKGVAVQNVSPKQIEGLVVPLPPLPEQRRVVAEVERHMSLIEYAEDALRANVVRCGRFRQSILKWAFEGKLADQDPNDEPASVLLDRIKAERETKANEPKSKTPKPRNGRKRNAA